MKVHILVMFLSLTLFTSLYANNNKLTVYYFDRLPYYGEINGKTGGIIVDISKLIFDEAGIEYTFEAIPSKRILEDLKKSGNYCSLGWLKTKERESLYSFSSDYIYQDEPYSVLIYNPKRSQLPTTPSIKEVLQSGLELGVIDGYVYGAWLDPTLKSYTGKLQKINIGDDAEKMYKMLQLGRFDYTFAGFEESSFILNNNPAYKKTINIVKIGDAPAGNIRYLLFSKGIDPVILEKINSAIPKVKQSDKYKQILSKIRTGEY